MRLLNILAAIGQEGKTRHYIGLPPSLTGGKDQRKRLVAARFLVVVDNPDGYFMYRFDFSGLCVGDTWHSTLLDAQEQAIYEYGNDLGGWTEIPCDIPPGLLDIRDYGLKQLRD